jgi:hypothetical protein
MAARIDDDFMTAEYGGRVIATARYSAHAAADGQGAWIVSGHPRRLFTRNQDQHAYELASSHGESGMTARLLPFTIDRLIWAASMVVLDASRRGQPVPRLAVWSLVPWRSGCPRCSCRPLRAAAGSSRPPAPRTRSPCPAVTEAG